MKYKIFIFYFIFIFSHGFAKQISKNENQSDTAKKLYSILVSLKEEIYSHEEYAIKKLDSLKPIVENTKNDSLIGLFYRLKYNLYSNQLKKELALEAINNSIFYYKKSKNQKGIVLSTMNKGNIYLFKSDYKNAIDNYLIALKIAKENNLEREAGLLNKNIGVVYSNQEKHDEALTFASKALAIFIKLQNEKEIGACYINIGNCYFNKYDADNAIKNYQKALIISNKIKDSTNISLLLNNIGTVYLEDKKDSIKGVDYIKQSLALKERLNDTNDILFQYTNIANLLANQKKYNEAKLYLDKAFNMAKKSDNKFELAEIYKIYSTIYEFENEPITSLKYYKLYKKTTDFLLSVENGKAVEELKIKFETLEKEKLILQNELKLKKQKNAIISLSFFGIFISFIGFLIYYQQKQKNKQLAQEFQLKSAINKIEYQNNLHEQRLAISRDLHDNIGAQLTFVISSVDNLKYGFNIKDSKIDSQLNKIKDFAKTSIIELRDTVWAMNSESFTFEDLQVRLINFIEKAEESYPNLNINFFLESNLKSKKISSFEGINIYRVIQESLNNALKYAQANTIAIEIKTFQNKILVIIKDDGIGFKPNEIALGNGILNMQKRMEDLNGEFKIFSTNSGTEIKLQFSKTNS